MERILLAGIDREYGNALAMAISNLHNEFEVTVFDKKPDILAEFSHQSCNDFQLILLDGFPDELVKMSFSEKAACQKVVVLTEYRTENMTQQSLNEERQVWYLYKYINVNSIIADLNFIIGYITGRKSFSGKGFSTKMIGFYSISGGVGKSVLSIGTARELSRYHDKKVLYISFEEFPASQLFIRNNSNEKSISDYLYYLFEKKDENLCSRMSGFISTDEFGVETFYPSMGRNDLKYLSAEELIYFLKNISESCRYDYLVFDLNSDLSEETLLLMEQCLKVVFIESDCPVSKYKNKKAMEYLNKINPFPLADGFLHVINKGNGQTDEVHAVIYDQLKMDEDEKEDFGLTDIKRIYIEKDEDSFRFSGNHFEISINHGFGIGVKQIADEILLSGNRNKQNAFSNASAAGIVD